MHVPWRRRKAPRRTAREPGNRIAESQKAATSEGTGNARERAERPERPSRADRESNRRGGWLPAACRIEFARRLRTAKEPERRAGVRKTAGGDDRESARSETGRRESPPCRRSVERRRETPPNAPGCRILALLALLT